MRTIEFKMEREGILEVGERISVTEGILPSSYYYTIDPSRAMSGNLAFRERLKVKEGTVVDIQKNDQGFYVSVIFDE